MRFAERWMNCAGCDLGQRREHEAAMRHLRMRQGEPVVVEDDAIHQQQVEIEGARPFRGRLSAIAAKLALDGEQLVE